MSFAFSAFQEEAVHNGVALYQNLHFLEAKHLGFVHTQCFYFYTLLIMSQRSMCAEKYAYVCAHTHMCVCRRMCVSAVL